MKIKFLVSKNQNPPHLALHKCPLRTLRKDGGPSIAKIHQNFMRVFRPWGKKRHLTSPLKYAIIKAKVIVSHDFLDPLLLGLRFLGTG